MRIATYNVWYPNIGIRAEQLVQEIDMLEADIIGLQEVPPDFFMKLTDNLKYPHHIFGLYDNEDEMGLAFFSRVPFSERQFLYESKEHENSIALNVIIEVAGIKLSVTNLHLPWDSVLAKEKQIVAIDRYIHSQKDEADFYVLLGDFNCTLESSVHHYLLGNQSLLGCEAKPYWNDLATAHASLNGYTVAPTLDFVNNPRWNGKNTNYVPDTCDRIYVMESFNWDYEFKLCDIRIFGKEVSKKTGYAPSDHYGVLTELEFTV